MKRENYRDTIFSIALITIILTGSFIVGTSAYFVSLQQIGNAITAGNSEIEITEDFSDPDYVFDGPTVIRKSVVIENVGANDCMVNVTAKLSDESMLKYMDGGSLPAGDGWSRDGDRYSYDSVLKPGDKTTPLFGENIILNIPASEENRAKNFDIFVYAESVAVRSDEQTEQGG